MQAALLREVEDPAEVRGWVGLATQLALGRPPAPVVLCVDGKAVTAAAWSPDGTRIATGTSDGLVWLWPAAGGAPSVVQRHDDAIHELAWSPEGRRLLGATRWRVILTDCDGGGDVLVWEIGRMYTARLSPDGSHVAVGLADGRVVVRPIEGGDEVVVRGGFGDSDDPEGSVAAWSPDGTRLVIVNDGEVEIRRADGGDPVALPCPGPDGPDDTLDGAFFLPGTERILAFGGEDAAAYLYGPDADGSGYALIWRKELPGRLVYPSADGTQLLALSEDSASSGIVVADSGDTSKLLGTEGGRYAESSPDGALALVVGLDPVVRLYETATGRYTPIFEAFCGGDPKVAHFSPDGRQLLVAGTDGLTRLWRLDHVTPQVGWTDLGAAPLVVATPDGATLARYEPPAWTLWRSDGAGEPLTIGETRNALARFSPDGRTLLTYGHPDAGILWRLDGAAGPMELQESDRGLHCAAFTSDGAYILGVSRGVARLWRADGTGPIRTFPAPSRTGCAALAPDGVHLIACSEDGWARIWRLDSGEPLQAFLCPGGRVAAAAYSPDGGRIALGSDSGIEILAADDGGHILSVPSPGVCIDEIAFSSDGSQILAASVTRPQVSVPAVLHTYAFPLLTAPALMDWLWSATDYCLLPTTRVALLAESDEEAARGYEAAKARLGRVRS